MSPPRPTERGASSPHGASGPGVAKADIPPIWITRSRELIQSSDVRIAALFDSADVVSEGASTGEDPERRYFGSSDIILRSMSSQRSGATLASGDLVSEAGALRLPLVRLIAADPHVRIRALRVARREAASRANGALARMRAEISFRELIGAVAVHVELDARVFPERRKSARRRS